jgi:hypothetical protein
LQAIASKADRLEKLLEKMEPNMWFVTGARWICGAFSVVVLCGVIYVAQTLATLNAKMESYADNIKRLEKVADDQQKANTELTRLIIERFPHKTYGAMFYEGRIIKVGPEEITIEIEKPEKKRLTWKLTTETQIFIKGRVAKSQDLKPDMRARITEGEKGKAAEVDVIDQEPE